MPLNPQLLKPEIKSAFEAAAKAYGSENSDAYLDTLSEKLATAIITHITSMGEVNGGICSPGGPIAGGKLT